MTFTPFVYENNVMGFTCKRRTLTLMSLERGLNFQPIACFEYINFLSHGHFDAQRSETYTFLKVFRSNYALNVDPVFELFFEIPYKKAGTLNWGRVVPKIE